LLVKGGGVVFEGKIESGEEPCNRSPKGYLFYVKASDRGGRTEIYYFGRKGKSWGEKKEEGY